MKEHATRRSRSLFGSVQGTQLLGALGIAFAGGLATLAFPRAAPLDVLLWLAWFAPVAGALAGAWRLPLWPLGFAVPAVWMFLLVWSDARDVAADLPTPIYAAMVWTGLYLGGCGIGALARPGGGGRAAAWTGWWAGVLIALPVGAGLLAEPLPAELAARALDASPATWVVESAGVDWMRHEPVYVLADTVRMDPSVRTGFRGFLAGPTALLLGWVLAFAGGRLRAARDSKPNRQG